MGLLEHIDSPKDLKQLPKSQLPEVCAELRSMIIDELSKNPGHLGASLGSVELTVALHYVFDTPYDRIVWDVGHQAYSHKILTGRRDRFKTNRQLGGLSGFPTPSESEYDSFVAGHASNSISAALGMAVAEKLKGDNGKKVIAVIGDGAMTGGLAFEGLNNASSYDNDLLIVLNDNGIAIDPIKSGMSRYLTSIHTSTTYNKLRYWGYLCLKHLGVMNEERKNAMLRWGNSLKKKTPGNNIFEGLNIRYFGPFDGHDVINLVETLEKIKDFKGPKVIHCITTKGKGYENAEREATIWHAPGLFNKDTGERVNSHKENEPALWQDVFGETLLELARKNERIVGVSPAMLSGCGMIKMKQAFPDRVFDVGIAEGHAVTFSAGMAREGLIPFCNIYSTFMQRAYDNVIHDVAIGKLNVVLCVDRAGIVGQDGITHQGEFDLAYFRCIPNLRIASPLNEEDLRNLMYTAQSKECGPLVIRYPRGCGILHDWQTEMHEVEIGKGKRLKDGKRLAVLSLGPIGNVALRVAEQYGDDVAVYDLQWVKPLDEDLLHEVGKHFDKVITIEDGVKNGGMGSAVEEWFGDHGYCPKMVRIGIPDTFVEHGKPNELYALLGMDEKGIANEIEKLLKV